MNEKLENSQKRAGDQPRSLRALGDCDEIGAGQEARAGFPGGQRAGTGGQDDLAYEMAVEATR